MLDVRERKKVLVTCPPFIIQKQFLTRILESTDFDVHWAETKQELAELELMRILPEFDGWILGDDPCSREVLKSGSGGKLRAVVKWGVGTDNIDFPAIREFNMKFANTPGMFGSEVADIAMAYAVLLARKIIRVHNATIAGEWLKPVGVSLAGKNLAVVGFGDIGKNIVKRAVAADLKVSIYEIDVMKMKQNPDVEFLRWPSDIEKMDFIVLACPLTPENRHMINKSLLNSMKNHSYIINVSRGGLVDENALVESLESGKLAGAALDVFGNEPLNANSPLISCENIVLGSHNASNTFEAVANTSRLSLNLMTEFLSDD